MNKTKAPVLAVLKTEPLLLSLREAGSLAGLTIWQIRDLITRREINHVWVGDRLYIRRATLLRWAEQAEQ